MGGLLTYSKTTNTIDNNKIKIRTQHNSAWIDKSCVANNLTYIYVDVYMLTYYLPVLLSITRPWANNASVRAIREAIVATKSL